MIKVWFKTIAQIAAVTAPLFTMQWSLLDLLGYPHSGLTTFSILGFPVFTADKPVVEFKLRAALTVVGVGLLFVYDAFEYYLPKRDLQQFRKDYLTLEIETWRKQLGPDVRINLLFLRRAWWSLWLIRYFHWTWNDGFAPEDPDANMLLLSWQGVCGQAVKTKVPQGTFFDAGMKPLSFKERWLFGSEFRLWGPQFTSTSHLKGVISIPLRRSSGTLSPKYWVVGVLNLDTKTEEGSKKLKDNQKVLADYFLRIGKILAGLK